MTEESTVQFTFTIDAPDLDDDRRQEIAQKLLQELRNLDAVNKADRVEKADIEDGAKPAFATLIGFLTAQVSLKNLKQFLEFLGERLEDKPIKVSLKVGDREVNIEAKSRQELLEGERVVKELLAVMGTKENA